jgi:hypothetical protein
MGTLPPLAAEAASPVTATGGNDPRRPQTQQQPQITTLAQALEHVPWDADQRGPLLAVAPQTVRPWRPKLPPGASPQERARYRQEEFSAQRGVPPPTAAGYRLTTIAPLFGRKMIRVGGLTVLAPTEMVVLNTRPGTPDLLAGMSRDQAMHRFAASLSEAQWRALGSPQGLGMGDLSPSSARSF